ncbi:MAG: SMI1/KNR4 family protein [Bacteroidales bacterium]
MSYFDTVLEYILPFKENGYKELDNGARLFGHAPHIAPEAYCHELFMVLGENDIDLLETEIKAIVPESYKSFLLNYSNGLRLFVRCLSLYGLRKQQGRDLVADAQPLDLQTPNGWEKPKNAQTNHFFIGGYGCDSSKLYMDVDTGKVHYCARRDATSLYEWESFEYMITEEIKRIFSLFDNKGVRLVSSKETLPV